MDFVGFRKTDTKNQQAPSVPTKKMRKETKAKTTIDQYFRKVESKNKNISEESHTQNGIEQFENYKKMVKLGDKRVESLDISTILFQKSLRERFERLPSLQTIQQVMSIPEYQELVQVFSHLDILLKNSSISFQEILIQLKQDYEIEFKVQTLQQILSIWPSSYYVRWQKLENQRYTLIITSQEQLNNQTNRTQVFKERLLSYIQKNGQYIALDPLPNLETILISDQSQQDSEIKTVNNKALHDQNLDQSKNLLKQFAIELQHYFCLRNVTNMYWNNVEKHLLKQPFISNNCFLQCLKDLINRFPEWIAIISGNQDKIIRVNKSLDIEELILESESLDCD